MGLANCSECGKVFIKTIDIICPACVRARDIELEKIREWINVKEYPRLSQIEQEINISEKTFRKYLLDGRIKAFKKVIGDCDMCGAPTNLETKNIICKNCRIELKKATITPEKGELEDTELYSKNKAEVKKPRHEKYTFKKPPE